MSFTFNPTGLIQNQTMNLVTVSKVDFVNKYGDFSMKYDRLTATGEQKHMLFYLVPLVLIILSIIFFVKSKQRVDENNKLIERTSTEKVFRILAWVSIIVLILSTGYSGYIYFMLYLPQYNQWFSELPIDAKKQLNLINTLNTITSTSNNRANQIARTASPSLFSIKF